MALNDAQKKMFVKLEQLGTFKAKQDEFNEKKFELKGAKDADLADVKKRTLKDAASVTGTNCTATFTPAEGGASLSVSVPEAAVSTLGEVYAANAADDAATLGTVSSIKGKGLKVTAIDNGVITKAMLATAVQNEIDAKATTEALNTAKQELSAATAKVASDLTDHEAAADTKYATKDDVNAGLNRLTSAIIPKGTSTFAKLPEPSADNLGFMYNVSDGFTTDDKFVEGAGKVLTAGTNVVVVDAGTSDAHAYKYDVFAGMVDTSAFVTTVNGTAPIKADRAGAVVTVSLNDLGVTSAKLAADAVETVKIKDAAVTDAKIADVAADKITGQVADTQIAAMSAAKLTGTVDYARMPEKVSTVVSAVEAMTYAEDKDIDALFA